MTLYEQTIIKGGGTFPHPDFRGLETPRFGFAVGTHHEDWAKVAINDVEGFYAAINSLTAFDPKPTFIGSWVDKGFIHIDPIMVLPTLESALLVGEYYNQDSVYDLYLEKVIKVTKDA